MNWDLVRLLAPQFVDDPRIPLAMELAAEEVDPDHTYRDRVVVLLAAHMIEMGDRAGVSGTVASKREGQLEVTFTSGDSSSLLAGTSYGAEAARLHRLHVGIAAGTGWLREDLSNVT